MVITQYFHMKELNREREILISLPDDWQTSGRRYPVMYIQDGQNAFYDDRSYSGTGWGFLEYVKNTGLEVILVAIPCNFEPWMREAEYGVWKTERVITILETGAPGEGLGGEGDAYVRFIRDELKPWIDAVYPTDPADTAIAGSSAGGNIAIYAALRYPETFPKCAALSCAFWYYPMQYLQLAQQADLSGLQVLYMDRGTNEGNGDPFINHLYNYDFDMIRDALMQKPCADRVHAVIWEGAEHNEAQWRRRVPVFMELFYPR